MDFFGSLFIYLFSASDSLLPSIPPLHASFCSPSHPVPRRTGAGGRAPARVSDWRGGDSSDRVGEHKRKSEGARAISWVSCAKVLNRRGGEGADCSQRDLIGSDFSFIHEEERGPVREGEGTDIEKKSPTNIFPLLF